jgi:hypothetical protein
MVKMSNPVCTLTKDLSKLKIKFNKKKYIKQYQLVSATCVHCGSTVLKYKMERHMRSLKCVRVRLAKIKV